MSNILEVKNLNAGYGKVPILHDITFHVAEGEVVGIIGPNGAGKSTLLKNICGLQNSYSGTIHFRGETIETLQSHKVSRQGLSYIPEGGRLFVNMTVRENLLMGAYYSKKVLQEGAVEEIFELFPALKKRSNQLAKTLSGGEKQMLAIGRGLISRPTLLLLDEPSLGLAPNLVDSIYERLVLLKQSGLTMLLVEQNTFYALDVSDRAYVLENGRIVMEGAGKELAGNKHIKTHYLGL
jgi:branched-chain amino acid transport system ATP-binding protein